MDVFCIFLFIKIVPKIPTLYKNLEKMKWFWVALSWKGYKHKCERLIQIILVPKVL